MNIIRLTDGQKRQLRVDHPLLNDTGPITDEQLAEAYAAGDRDTMIEGFFFAVRVIVGRFLANWPETRRFEEDMISEGLLTITEACNTVMKTGTLPSNFQGVVWTLVRRSIEDMLNDNRSMFAAPNRTQWDMQERGTGPVYNYAKQLEEAVDIGLEDYSLEYVDILDELSHLAEEDQETLRKVICLSIEQDHNIMEADLTQAELDSIDQIVRAITECSS
jgi:hypothetical protein